MEQNIHLEANVVAVNSVDLIPPSSMSEQTQSKILGAETKSDSHAAILMFATLMCVVIFISLVTLKYRQK